LSSRAKFALALAGGVVLALFALVLGLIAMAATLLAAVLAWINLGRFAFAGLAIGIGGTWTALFVIAAQDCAAPSQPCGATPIDLTPHIVVSLLVLLSGVVVGLLAVRRSRADVSPG
jgi:hypothetical protein